MAEKNKSKIIEEAIADGAKGATLGARLTGKSKNTLVSSIVGVAIEASIKAQEEAKKIGVPVLYEEGLVVYKVYPNGKGEVVKKLEKIKSNIPQTFSLD